MWLVPLSLIILSEMNMEQHRNMSEDVGARLRSVRTVRGLSQRALAKRCGVANATIIVCSDPATPATSIVASRIGFGMLVTKSVKL